MICFRAHFGIIPRICKPQWFKIIARQTYSFDGLRRLFRSWIKPARYPFCNVMVPSTLVFHCRACARLWIPTSPSMFLFPVKGEEFPLHPNFFPLPPFFNELTVFGTWPKTIWGFKFFWTYSLWTFLWDFSWEFLGDFS